jgi:hypothetical protein
MSDLDLTARLDELRIETPAAPARAGKRGGAATGRRGKAAIDFATLPSNPDDPRWGMPPADVEVVAAVLSRCIATHDLKGSFTNTVCWMLALYGTTPVFDAEGKALGSVPHPEIDPAGPWPGGRRAFNSLPLRHRGELHALYEAGVARYGVRFFLPLDLLGRFVAPTLWPVVMTMLADRPVRANMRLANVLQAESRRVLKATKSLPERTVSKGALKHSRDAFRALMHSAVKVNAPDQPVAALEGWISLPDAPSVDGPEADSDQEAVPFLLLRQDWRRRQREIDKLLRRLPGESEQAALERLPASALRHDGLFTELRDRLVFFFAAVLGVRPVVLTLTRLCDYDARRLWEGNYAPAIGIRGHKTTRDDDRAWKILPESCRPVIETYLEFRKRYYREVAHVHELEVLDPASPLPLVLAELARPSSPYSEGGMSNKFSGRMPSGHSSKTTPMLSKHPASEGLERYIGYKAGQFRHAALQAVEFYGSDYVREIKQKWQPRVMGEALVDHAKITGDELGYYDRNKARGRARLSAHAARVLWEALTTDRGARRGPDVDAFTKLLDQRSVLEAETALHREDVEALKRRADGGENSSELVIALITKYGDLQRLENALGRIDVNLERLKHPRRYVVLSDAAPDEDQFLDLRALERDFEAEIAVAPEPASARRWVGVREFAKDVLGPYGSEASVKRWVQGDLPYAPGDPRNPWEADAVPVTGQGHRRRIWIDGIKPTFWATKPEAVRDRLRAMLRTPGPKGWAAAHLGPLSPPEGVVLGAVDLRDPMKVARATYDAPVTEPQDARAAS